MNFIWAYHKFFKVTKDEEYSKLGKISTNGDENFEKNENTSQLKIMIFAIKNEVNSLKSDWISRDLISRAEKFVFGFNFASQRFEKFHVDLISWMSLKTAENEF